jgi:hypothetical protein
MKTLRFALVALVATFLGCPPTKTPADWPTDPTNDKDILSTCTAAHAKLNELNCNEKRTDFVAFCTYTIGQGIPLHPQCIAAIKTCGELDKCR